MYVRKVQVEVYVKSLVTHLPVPRRVAIQRGESSPFRLEKASFFVINQVFLFKITGSFSKVEKLGIFRKPKNIQTRITQTSEASQILESKNFK